MSTVKERLAKRVNSGQTPAVNVYHLETDTDVVLVKDSNETLSDHLDVLDANRTVTLSGDVSGSGTLQSGQNLTISTQVSDDSHEHTGSTLSVDTANRVVVSDSTKNLEASDVTTTELGYLKGVTGGIQGQLDNKSDTDHNHDTVYVKQAMVGVENGVAPLDNNGLIGSQYLPSFVDDVIDSFIVGDTPMAADWLSKTSGGEALTPESGKVYLVVTAGEYQNRTFRWSGTTYAAIRSDLVIGETENTAYRGDRGAAAYAHSISAHARVDATKVEGSDSNGYIQVDGQNLKVYEHPTTAGNKHLPSGGQSGDVLGWQADGTGTWVQLPALSKGAGSGNGNAVTDISVNGHEINLVKGQTFLTEHPPITLDTDTTSTATPSFGGTFTAVDSVTREDNGHVEKINVKTVTLPTETTLSLGNVPSTDAGNVVTGIEVNGHRITPRKESTVVLEGDSRLTDARTPTAHTHGNLTNDGKLQADDVAIGTGDRMVIADSSNEGKIAKSGVIFDGADTTKALTPKGTFETFLKEHQDISGKADKTDTVTNVAFDATNKKITKTINGTTTDVVTVDTIRSNMNTMDVGAKGLVPAPSTTDATRYLKGDGTWDTPENTTYDDFDGTNHGLVPAPGAGDSDKFLKSDGTWASPAEDTDTTYTFTGGQTNKFTVTPSNGTAQDVTITPSATITASVSNDTGADVTLSGTNGTNEVTYSASHKEYHNTAPGSKGPTADGTLTFGGTFKVPQVSANTTGHVDAIAEHTMTMPSETQLSLGSATGDGNAITALQVNNHEITPIKGATFLTEHQDISGKADKSATVSDVAYDHANDKLTKTINGSTTDVLQIVGGDNVTVQSTAGTVTISSENTDTKVTQTARSVDDAYPVLLSGEGSAATTTGTRGASFATGVTVNPSTGAVSATSFSGSGANLTNLPSGQLTGTIDAARLPDLSNTYSVVGHNHDATYIQQTAIGAANGVAPLDSTSKISSLYLPSYVDDVLEYDSMSAFPETGEAGKIYVDKATNKTYRWGGSSYVEISPSITVVASAVNGKINVSGEDVTVYVHPADKTAQSGFKKLTTDTEGHVTGGTDVAASDVKGLSGIDMSGASAEDAGAHGMVPAPAAGDQGKFLSGAGTWATPANDNTTYTFTGGTNKITVTPSDGQAQDVTVTPSATIAANASNAVGAIVTLSGTAGTNGVTYSASHANSGVTAGTYGAAQTAAFGVAFKIPTFKVNATGHLEEAGTVDITMPANPNTDTKVTQSSDTSASAIPVLMAYQASPTSGTASGAKYNSNVTITPSTGTVTATAFSGNGSALTNLNASNIASGTINAARLPTSGVTATSYGPAANATLSYGGTFTVPQVTFDTYGRATSAATRTMTMPADRWGVHVQSGATQPTNQSSGDLWFQTL